MFIKNVVCCSVYLAQILQKLQHKKGKIIVEKACGAETPDGRLTTRVSH